MLLWNRGSGGGRLGHFPNGSLQYKKFVAGIDFTIGLRLPKYRLSSFLWFSGNAVFISSCIVDIFVTCSCVSLLVPYGPLGIHGVCVRKVVVGCCETWFAFVQVREV